MSERSRPARKNSTTGCNCDEPDAAIDDCAALWTHGTQRFRCHVWICSKNGATWSGRCTKPVCVTTVDDAGHTWEENNRESTRQYFY